MIRESARVIVKSTFKRLGLEVVHREQNASALIEEIYGERDLLLTNVEAEQLFRVVRSVSKVPGDIAEVGVYTGASSRIIREAEPLKAFHLFDTFAGLPAPSTKDDRFQAGSYRSSLSDVKQYLDRYSGLQFYPGVFPSTAGPVENRSFSFVHLDVDLYQSTIDALKFFWPRMATHGVILSHDYSTSTGVPAAFDEFFLSQSTPVIQLSDSYCLVMR